MGDISAPATAVTNMVIFDTHVYNVLASLDPSKSSGEMESVQNTQTLCSSIVYSS